MKKCIGYLRTSSQTNVGEEKDSGARQLRAIKSFCKSKKYTLTETFYDANVSGSKSLSDRAQLIKAVQYCETNNITTILVESSDRFSRDLMVQENLLWAMQSRNINVLCSNNDRFSSTDTTDTFQRHIQGATNQYTKDQIVERLRVSRENKKDQNKRKRTRKTMTLQGKGKCEGAPQYYSTLHKGFLVATVKKLRIQDKWTLNDISYYLKTKYSIVNSKGKQISRAQISRILEYKPIRWRA
jgi:DNA invertase Pin-like site-specific DNA recombinase